MATLQASSAVASQPCQGAAVADIPDSGKAAQSPSFSELKHNSLVSDDTNKSEALKLLRKQLRSSVTSAFAPGGGVASTTKSLTEERTCSTPLVLPAGSHPFRTVNGLTSIPSPIPLQSSSSAPCSPRNGRNVLQNLSTSQLSSPVQRMVSTSAHPSSIISSFTSSASGSSVFAPLSASRSLISSHNPPGTPPHFQHVMSNLLSPLGISAHAAHVARSSAAETASSPSSSPRPGILRKRNNEGVSKVTAAAVAAISASSAARLDMSTKPAKMSNISTSTASTSLESVAPARKKPRKQNMVATEDPLASNVPPAKVRTSATLSSSSSPVIVAPIVTQPAKASIQQFPYRKRMPANYGTNYKASCATGSKATLNHFQRSTDVRVKEEKRLTLAELNTHRSQLHDLQGWKVNLFVENLDNMPHYVDTNVLEMMVLEAMEKNKIDIVNDYLSQISAIQSEDKRVKEELHMVAELMKGNLQRSKVLIEHIEEARQHLTKLCDHRPGVVKLFHAVKGRRGGSSTSTSSTSGSGSKRKG